MGKQFIAISLESCTEIVKGFDSADFDALQRLYRKHCLTDCHEGETDDRFESCFLSVLLQWREAAAEASTRKWGLLGVAA